MPQLFTIVDVDRETLKTADISDRTISTKLKDSPKVKSNAWMETSQTLLENTNNDLSEEDFPSLQSPRQSMLEKTSSSKNRILFGKESDLEDGKVKFDEGEVFVDMNFFVWSKYEAQSGEEELPIEAELKVSATTNLEEVNIKNHAYQEEVDIKNNAFQEEVSIKNHPIQEEIVDEDQLEEEKVEKLGEKEGREDLTKNQNQNQEELAENQTKEEVSENQNQEEVVSETQHQAQEEVSKKPKQEGEVSETPNQKEVAKKPMQIQMNRMHAMLSGLIVPFGQF